MTKTFAHLTRRRILFLSLFAVTAVLLLLAFDNRLLVRQYTVEAETFTAPIRIVLVTDLHSCDWGEGQSDLIRAIDEQKPELILLGGDIFDDVKDDTNTVQFLTGIADRYPCYYVTGNHECWSGNLRFAEKMAHLEALGIPVLENEAVDLQINGQVLCVCGVDDPDRDWVTPMLTDYAARLDAVSTIAAEDTFTILLAHRPEYFDQYAAYDFDLVLCGHAHGGQWRIPYLLNGVYAPHQGIFPRYAGGRYEENGTTMIVSRGLARETTWVPRIFNRPELVVIDITPPKTIH